MREEEWAGKDKAWVKNTHPFAFEINEKIKEKLEVLDKLVKRYHTANKSLTFPLVFRELKKRNNTDSFLAYFDDYIKDPRETVDEKTLKRYRSCWNHLSRFNHSRRPIKLTTEASVDYIPFKNYCQMGKNCEFFLFAFQTLHSRLVQYGTEGTNSFSNNFRTGIAGNKRNAQ